MPIDALSTSEALQPAFIDDPTLLVLARAYDQISEMRVRLSDLQAFHEDFGHYLPLVQRKAMGRLLSRAYDDAMTLRRIVLDDMDARMGI